MVISLERVIRQSEWKNVYYLSVPESEWAKVSTGIMWPLENERQRCLKC